MNFTIDLNNTCPKNLSLNYTDKQVDDLLAYKHYINGWSTLIVIPIGIIANLITIYILFHRKMRQSSTNAYLLALSSSNLISLVCLLLMNGLRFTIVHPYRSYYCRSWYENFINRSMPFLTPINQNFQLSSIYLITAVSIDRYIIVKSTMINSKKRRLITYFVILLIFLFCFILTLPNWFMYQSKLVANDNYFIKYYITELTSFGSKSQVRIIHRNMYLLFVIGLPIVVLLVVNTLIIYELIKIGDRKRKLRIDDSNIDRNITYMLVAIVLVFLLCQVPLAVSHILLTYKHELSYERNFFIYNSFTNFLTCIYMSSNFVLFCFFGQKFRSTLRLIFFKSEYKKCNLQAKNLNVNDKDFGNLSTYVNINNQNNQTSLFSVKKPSFLQFNSFVTNNEDQKLELEDLNIINSI